METKNYSLEKHLEAICREDKDYDLLLAVWQLNKENLAAALKNIASMFPHYSQHDISHSIKILDNIQRLLGRDRVERLGATDTFLILMSALTHDLGMYMTYEMVEKEWDKPEMKQLIESFANSSDKQIAVAARLLQDHGPRPANSADGYKWALEIRNAVTIILAHQMRRGHGDRSAEHLEKSDFFRKYANQFHFDSLPDRYLSLIAQVAHLHGTDFDEVLDLPQRAAGFKSDDIHPRFIASMIRMGDLLDIDNKRFNPFSMATVKEMPESSQAHYDKHQAVKHLLISPEGIEADLDCPTEASFRTARELFDWLESEVEKLCREWSVIAPSDLGGLPPVLHKDKINIYYKGARTRPELRNLRFEISSQRTFEMLKGGAIYKNPGRVFLREIVQNALDATKLQIWKDMDIHLPFVSPVSEHHFTSRKELKETAFSDDIPASVYEKYPINLKIDYDEENQAIIVTCEDLGTGISEESLIRMTSQVGASRKADRDYEKTVEGMPYFLQPTAAFGLGLQTVFYIADEFTVDTHYPGEPSRRIVFRSSANGSYCSIEKEDLEYWNVIHGTRVRIVVDKNHLGKLFELDKEDSQEVFKHTEAVYGYIDKIDGFARDNFTSIEGVLFRYQSCFETFRSGNEKKGFERINENKNYRLWGKYQDEPSYEKGYVYLMEDRELGARMKVLYTYDSDVNILARNIPVKDINVWHYSYVDIELNLWSRESDKLVSISRDEFLPLGVDWCNDKLGDLLRVVIQQTHNHLLEQYCKSQKEDVKKVLLVQYCYLCMRNWILSKPIEGIDLSPLEGFSDCLVKFYNNRGSLLSIKEALESLEIVVIDIHYYYNYNDVETIKSIKSILKYSSSFSGDLVIATRNAMISSSFICYEMFFVKNKDIKADCIRLKKGDPDTLQWVTISNDDIQKVSLFGYYCLYGFSKYKEIVVGKDAPLMDFSRPYHGNCWIYPIKQNSRADLPPTRSEAREYLRKPGMMETFVPDHIVRIIMRYNALGRPYPTEEKALQEYKEEIYDTYIRMILDNKFGVEAEVPSN